MYVIISYAKIARIATLVYQGSQKDCENMVERMQRHWGSGTLGTIQRSIHPIDNMPKLGLV